MSDLVGRSLPSKRYGAWIVAEDRGERVRLVTGNLKGEQWRWRAEVEAMLEEVAATQQPSSEILERIAQGKPQ